MDADARVALVLGRLIGAFALCAEVCKRLQSICDSLRVLEEQLAEFQREEGFDV